MLHKYISVLALVSAVFSTTSFAASEREDHPLLAGYPGAEIRKTIVQAYEPFQIPTSIVNISSKPYKYSSISVTGDLARHVYRIKDVSSLKVYENYAAAIKKLGFNITFSCQLDACGDKQQAAKLGELISADDTVYNNSDKPYYFVAEKQGANGIKIYGAWFVGAYENEVAVQQVISEVKPLENNLIKIDAGYTSKTPASEAVEKGKPSDLEKDHKLFARYPNAYLRKSSHVDTEVVIIPTAPNAEDKTPLNLTGDLSRHVYTVQDVSSLKVFENYKQALNKAGFSILSKCELAECGSEEAIRKVGDKVSLDTTVYNWYRKPYYVLAKKASESGDIYVAIFVGAYESEVGIQQLILQQKGVVTGLIKVDADGLKQQIDADGKALIYGIYFDTGKSAVKPESKPTLDAIAQLLTKNKDLLLYVVGHTDDTGAGAANVELSRQRAAAVVNELATTYKIPATRLQAQGVGPYAPAGNNTSDAGKQKNRRVELVKRLQ
jgi:outer membrane protein OmpA-like peptidoglycan-associated protein